MTARNATGALRRHAVPTHRDSGSRPLLFGCAALYTAFVVYGSLVPLDFRPYPFEKALEAFLNIRYLSLGIASRADWVANILLFIPLAFLGLGALWPRSATLRVLATAFVVLLCAGFSAAIEFVQIYFPPRTVSLNDIIAETLGACIGVAAWHMFGERSIGWLRGMRRASGREQVLNYLLSAYLILLFGYHLLPLDLTLSPIEIFHKWREGRIRILPFQGWGNLTGVKLIYELASDVAVWIPPAALWVLRGQGRPMRAFVFTLGAAAMLEVFQVFVYSRVADITDVLTAACGATAGIAAIRLFGGLSNRDATQATSTRPLRLVGYCALGASLWCVVLIFVFWYPFDFNHDWSFVRERIASLKRLPFERLYFGTEFRAVTEVLHKTSFFFPLGLTCALAVHSLTGLFGRYRIVLHCCAFAFIVAAAAAIELGQLFLPGRIADLTDWFLEVLGGMTGYVVLLAVAARWTAAPRH